MNEFSDSIIINHFRLLCEFSVLHNSLVVFFECTNGSNFQFLGCLDSMSEWETLKSAMSLIIIKN